MVSFGGLGNRVYFCSVKSSHMSNLLNISIMEKYVCDLCGWEYDPAVGCPEAGIAPGTAWKDVPEDFECPLCGATKDQFSKT